MIVLLAAAVLLWVTLSRPLVLSRAYATMKAALADKALSIVAVLAALVVLLRGNVWVALVFFGFALWLLGRATRREGRRAAPHQPQVSRLRSAMIEMAYDHQSGRLFGWVIAGHLEGRALDQLDRLDCERLHAACLAQDPDGARLLEAYLDRRFAGWRRTYDRDADTRARAAHPSGRMSEEEAYEVLGLRPGATRDDITRSHRTVMKKWHPDQGGTAALAARANEAREVLLRRHAENS
jgi:type IV secretory pathway TrbD component